MEQFVSILDYKDCGYQDKTRPAYFVDLNLPQVMEKISGLYGGDIVPFYYYFPADEECEQYRREVYGDVKKQEIYEVLTRFTEAMKLWKTAQENREKVRMNLQKGAWFAQETDCYCKALESLQAGLKAVAISSKGLNLLAAYLEQYLSGDGYAAIKKRAEELLNIRNNIHFLLQYENNQLVVSEGEFPDEYEKFLKNIRGEFEVELKSPFGINLDLSSLEAEIYKVYAKKHLAELKLAEQFMTECADYQDEVLLRFTREIGFYLSFRLFTKKMGELGYPFATPTVDKAREMGAYGLYDLALAVVNSKTGKEVIANDFSYKEGEKFFVLTGPNQGGKTTFARSLGQFIYLAKLGLDVPALSANVHYYKGILTHFSVEESIETGRGKLQEELVRLSPMMESNFEYHFVIINELFTTAANYDACIMGKRVLDHFIGQKCMGIYVTHLRELTEGTEGVVSLRACLDENRIQSFKILRSAAEESACAINQVNKYKLTYEQLKERLS